MILENESNLSFQGSGNSISYGFGESKIVLNLSELLIKSESIPSKLVKSYIPLIFLYVSGHVFSLIHSVGFGGN
jgi:hypothetical protein